MRRHAGNCCVLLGRLLFVALLGGCASGPVEDSQRNPLPVRRVDFSEAPHCAQWAAKARELGNEVYPKILALLIEDPATVPQQFDIVFKHLKSGSTAEAQVLQRRQVEKSQVVFNTDYIAKESDNLVWRATNAAQFDSVLVHEMVHVAQHRQTTNLPMHWIEGTADYVRYKLGYANYNGPECKADCSHYELGYACAGAFLLYIDRHYDTNVARKLNTRLQRQNYCDDFFVEITGKSLDELWKEFQETPAFTAGAKRINKIHSLLGYVNGKPPPDIDARFEAYVRRLRGGTNTLEALNFLKGLSKKGKLPGFSKKERAEFPQGERGGGSFVMPPEKDFDTYPISRTLYCYKANTDGEYNYIVVRQSPQSPWRIARAWQTANERQALREIPIK